MKLVNRKLTGVLVSAFCVFVVSNAAVSAQSLTEADALAAIKSATNPTTKLTAAEDFIAKFPTAPND